MKNKLLLLLLITTVFFLISLQSRSQSAIKGIIKNGDGKILQFANVKLLKSADSTIVKSMNSDTSGSFSFENIPYGSYLVTASFTGMIKAGSPLIETTSNKKEVNAGELYLENGNVRLKNVSIVAKKPLFEQKIDRMVINVKNSITDAGGTALDVLEKSPGVTVNRQNNSIAVNGKSGVTVMINGKISYMPADALVQLLGATSADNIDKLELITSPPSKYDAEGNGGYINIVFINNPDAGFNGSYFLTAGYGNKESAAGGVNFNYRSSKINLFGSYSYKYDHYLQPSSGFTQYVKGGDIISNSSYAHRDAITNVQNARVGIDYQLSPSTIVGGLVGGYISHWSMTSHNGTAINTNGLLDTTITTLNKELNYWNNVTTNLNFQHTFKPGNVLCFDMNYIYYKDYNPNTYLNNYYNNAGQPVYSENLKSDKTTPINFRVASLDYTTPLGKKVILETGGKISLSRFTNTAGVSRLTQGIFVPDSNLSARYLLRENISAAYTSININPNSKLSVKAGLRYEYTTSNLGTTETANIIDKKYGQLFPTLFISQRFDEDNSISFSYSRRITRPAFTDLAPFTIFFDPKTFFSGNPALQPAIANTLQASYGLSNYIFSLTYTQERNTIESYYFQTSKIDTVNNIVYLSANNFKSEHYLIASFSLPFTINNIWSMQNNINLNWKQVNTVLNNSPVNFKIFDYNINSTQRIKLPKDYSLELTGFYTSSSYYGTTKFKPIYQLNFGVQKKFNNRADILRLTANDIFNTAGNYRFTDNLTIPNTLVTRNFNFGLLSCKLTYTHSFGNKALKEKKGRSTGAEDELNRVHN